MEILIAMLPSLLWGVYSLVIPKIGGDDQQQTFGVTLGALAFSLIVFPFQSHHYSLLTIVISFLSGIFWMLGCFYQLKGFKLVGVSRTIPITTGMQLVGVSLLGVLFFGEWNTTSALLIGGFALLLLCIGVTLIGYTDEKEGQNVAKGVWIIFISSVAFIVCVTIVKFFNIPGEDVILPQAVGMVLGSSILSRNTPERFSKRTLLLMLPGALWAIGNLVMLYANNTFGVALGFPMSQLGCVIATLGGLFLLGEKKTPKEKKFMVIGLFLIILGVFSISYAKTQEAPKKSSQEVPVTCKVY